MTALNRTALLAFINANLIANGTNAITGDQLNTILVDLTDSFLNLSDDSTSLALDIYRAGSFVGVAGVQKIVTFSSALSVSSYEVFIQDNGLGWENIVTKTTASFKITPLSSGTYGFYVILNN